MSHNICIKDSCTQMLCDTCNMLYLTGTRNSTLPSEVNGILINLTRRRANDVIQSMYRPVNSQRQMSRRWGSQFILARISNNQADTRCSGKNRCLAWASAADNNGPAPSGVTIHTHTHILQSGRYAL